MIHAAKFILLLGALVGFATPCGVGADTIQTLGSGSAVSVPERIATFDSLTSTNTRELGSYAEGGLYVTTGNQSWGAELISLPQNTVQLAGAVVYDDFPGTASSDSITAPWKAAILPWNAKPKVALPNESIKWRPSGTKSIL